MSVSGLVLGVSRIVPALLTLAGVSVTAIALHQLLLAVRSKRWPAVQGTVLGSRVDEVTGDEATLLHPIVRYRYTVNGQNYTGTRIRIGGPIPVSWPGPAVRLVSRYPAGHICQVYLNPADPSSACLEPGVHWQLLLLPLIGSTFLGLGIGLFLTP